jgi:ABC-type glutathione transport system ATPase component
MMEDYQTNYSLEEVENGKKPLNDLLINLAERFSHLGKTMDAYGLPSPEQLFSELDQELARYSQMAQQELLEELNRIAPNNDEQQEIFDTVTDAVDNKQSQFFFIQGQAGSGKTTLAKKLMAYVRSKGEQFIIVRSQCTVTA